MNPRKWVPRLRRLTLGLATLGVLFLVWRYDRLVFPAEGCSPLTTIAPGDVLLVDVRPRQLPLGSALFVRVAGNTYLGRLTEVDELGRLWLEAEVAECPGTDSDTFGWLTAEQVVGRVLVALPF